MIFLNASMLNLKNIHCLNVLAYSDMKQDKLLTLMGKHIDVKRFTININKYSITRLPW